MKSNEIKEFSASNLEWRNKCLWIININVERNDETWLWNINTSIEKNDGKGARGLSLKP